MKATKPPKIFYTFGIVESDIETSREDIERIMGIRMVPHESMSRGNYYRYSTAKGADISLLANMKKLRGLDEKERFSEKYREYPLLLFVSYLRLAPQVLSQLRDLPGWTLLEGP